MALTHHLDKSKLEKKENKQTQQLIETFHCSPQQLGKSPFLLQFSRGFAVKPYGNACYTG